MAQKKAASKTVTRQTGKTTVKNDGNAIPVLDQHERLWLLEVLNDPKFQKALDVINLHKPSVFPRNGFGVTPDIQRHTAECRIYEIRGWELYHAMIMTVADAPKPKAEYADLPEPTYGITEDE